MCTEKIDLLISSDKERGGCVLIAESKDFASSEIVIDVSSREEM